MTTYCSGHRLPLGCEIFTGKYSHLTWNRSHSLRSLGDMTYLEPDRKRSGTWVEYHLEFDCHLPPASGLRLCSLIFQRFPDDAIPIRDVMRDFPSRA